MHELIEAAKGNDAKRVRELLEGGANPDIQNNDGWTALIAAAHEGRAECAKLLLENGAWAGIQDAEGETALGHAKTAEIRKLLQDE